jgi:flagellin-like hook-associated protein FlgL
MTVNFISTAALNQRTEKNINEVLTQRNEAGRQIQTGKKFENIYDASASEASDMVNIQESIDVQKKEAEILQRGFRRIDEMSDSLDDMGKYLKSKLADWQKYASGAMSDDFTQDKQKDFAEKLLKGMEIFLNKRSIYDKTYLFSGDNMDTKPVNLSGSVDPDKYYLGSKYDMSFTYGDNQIKLDFNAGDSSIKSIVELFVDVKNNSAGDKDDVFVKFEKCVEEIVGAKERIDFKSKDLKQFSDMQKVNIENGIKSYDDIAKVHEYTGYTELLQFSKRLSEIYSSIGALSKSLVDYL